MLYVANQRAKHFSYSFGQPGLTTSVGGHTNSPSDPMAILCSMLSQANPSVTTSPAVELVVRSSVMPFFLSMLGEAQFVGGFHLVLKN